MRSDPTQTGISANDPDYLADNGEYNVSNDGTIGAASHFGTGELVMLKQTPLPQDHVQES